MPPVAGDVYPSLHVHAYSLTPVSAHERAAASPHGSTPQSLMSVHVPSVAAYSLTPVSAHERAAASPHGSTPQSLMSVHEPPVAGDVYPSLHMHAYGRTR